MGDIKTDSFVVPVQITENVTTALKQIASTASQGITLGITMESDAGKVISDIHKISSELEKAINSKNFDMDKLLNLNNAIVKLGEFKYTVEGLDVIFNTLTSSVTSLNGAMTEIASIKMDTKQFSAFQNALSSINANVEKIVQKLDSVGSSSSMQKVSQGAKEATSEIKQATQATEELKQAQDKAATTKTASPHDKYMGRSFEILHRNLNTAKLGLQEVDQAIGDAAIRANDILDAKHLGKAKTVDQFTKKIASAEAKIKSLKKSANDATGVYEIDLQSQITYWERVILDAEHAMSHLQGQGGLSNYKERRAEIDAESRSLKNELDKIKQKYTTEQQLIEETIQKKKELYPDEWNKHQAAEAEKAAEAERKRLQLEDEARAKEEKKKAAIQDNLKEYQELGAVLDQLIAKQQQLSGNSATAEGHIVDGVSESNALEMMISKANEFYKILDSTDKPTEELHAQLVSLAADLKYLTSTYNSIFDKNRTRSLENGYGLGAIIGDIPQFDSAKQRDEIQKQISDTALAMRQADNRIKALSGGKTAEAILEETRLQQQVGQAAQEAGQAQVQSQQKVLENADAIEKKLKSVANTWKKVKIDIDKVDMSDPKAFKMEDSHVNKADLKNGVPTQASVKRALDSYLQAPSEESKQKLIAYVAALNDSTKAATIFGQKNESVFKEISAEIENTKSSLKAYQKYSTDISKVLYGTKGINLNGEQAQAIDGLIQKGDIAGAMQALTEYCGKLQETEVREESVSEAARARIKAQKETVAPVQSMQQTADQTATAAANAEKLEQNLAEAAVNADNLEKQMTDVAAKTTNATVTGTVSIGNKVPVTGANGEQLALEKTLRATYSIQQNMVKILSEINAKMVSGANAATASYEQLKAVMTETVEAAKNLGAEEEKEAKKSAKSQTQERYAIVKKDLQEILRLKKQLPKAGENEAKQIQKQIKHYQNQVNYQQRMIKNTGASITLEEQKVDVLKRQIELQNSINADAREKAKVEAKNTATKKLESSYNTTSKTLRSIGGGNLMATAESATVQELIQQFRQYDSLLATVGNDFTKLSDTQQKEIQESIDKFNQLTQAQKDAFKAGAYNTYNKGGKYQGTLTDLSKDNELSGLKGQVDSGAITQRAALEQVAASIAKAKVEVVDYNAETGKLTAQFKDQQKNLQQLTIGFQDVGNATRHSIKPLEQYQSAASKMFSGIGKKLKELLRYFSSFTIIMSVINSIKKGVQVVREMDTALTELKVVTGSTAAEMAKFQKQAQQVASAIASTTLEVTRSATEWSRLGYAMADALELAEQSAIYSKVGATDINVATENLTATLQAFYSDDIRNGIISAGDAAEIIVDKLVNVGDKFASSAAGMGQGISKAGAALIAANNTLDESLALITAGTTILQNEDETASALRTISLRLRGTKASELEAAGEDVDGAIEDISKLYKIVKDMTAVNGGEGVEIFNTDTGAYKSTYEILLEISKVWDEMTDLQQAGILETIAGKTRSNAAAAILSSGEILEDAYKVSTESAGVAAEKMEVYLNSIESHIAEFKQATSVLWENTLSSDLIKGFVDFGTAIVKLTDKVGLLSVALAGVFGYFGAKGQGRHINQGVSTKYA